MTRLLYIEGSPRKKRSSSTEVAHAYLSAYRKKYPGDEIETLDLWAKEMPEFDEDVIDSKHAILRGQRHTEAQHRAWKPIEEMIANFKQADRYLFSVPMWNFCIPYKLKHYFDIIVQPSYTFAFSQTEGYKGLVTGKPVVVIYSRAGAYSPGTGFEAFDFQKTYMDTLLPFIGFTEIYSVLIEHTSSVEMKEEAVKQAIGEAVKLVV